MPSVADLIFVALLGTLTLTPLAVRLLGDAGIGWHIRTGQVIAATHAVPRVDPFSATMAGRQWYAWEWLYDFIVGELERGLGLNGVVWFNAAVIAAVFGWTFQLLIGRRVHVVLALLLVLLAVCASMIHFLARPHVVSWLFTVAWFVILSLDSGVSTRRRWLWALPLLMLVWVNVHGGFLIGFVLLGIFWLGAVWDWYWLREDRIEEALQRISAGQRARDLFGIGVLCAAVSLVNPYGWALHRHVYAYLSNSFLMDHIEEFQSPNFHRIAQKSFLVLLLLTLATVAVRGRRLRVAEILVLLFAVYAGLYASRNIPVSAILVVLIVGRLLATNEAPRGAFGRMAALQGQLHGHFWPLAMILVTLGIAANGGKIGSSQWMDAHFDAKRFPVQAVSYLEQRGITERVLAPDYWGGFLIYRGHRVVVDDRHDLYGEEFLKSYLKTIHGERGWNEFLADQAVACTLLPRDSALASILAESSSWREIYTDEVAVVYQRAPQLQNPAH